MSRATWDDSEISRDGAKHERTARNAQEVEKLEQVVAPPDKRSDLSYILMGVAAGSGVDVGVDVSEREQGGTDL